MVIKPIRWICFDQKIGSKNGIIMNFIESAPAVRSICTLHELETNHSDSLLSPGKTICIGGILVEDKLIDRRVIWGFCAQQKLRKPLAIAGGEREIGQVTNNRYT